MVWRAVYRGWRHTQCWPPTIAPIPHHIVGHPYTFNHHTSLAINPPVHPPVAADEQPLTENIQFFNTNFHIFSALGVK